MLAVLACMGGFCIDNLVFLVQVFFPVASLLAVRILARSAVCLGPNLVEPFDEVFAQTCDREIALPPACRGESARSRDRIPPVAKGGAVRAAGQPRA